jgi:hypothetical protein
MSSPFVSSSPASLGVVEPTSILRCHRPDLRQNSYAGQAGSDGVFVDRAISLVPYALRLERTVCPFALRLESRKIHLNHDVAHHLVGLDVSLVAEGA